MAVDMTPEEANDVPLEPDEHLVDRGVMTLATLMRTIARDGAKATRLVTAHPHLATEVLAVGATRANAAAMFLDEIQHYMYAGDTALHIAAAAYRSALVRKLVALGADVRARNRRGQTALHYAVDGNPASASWNPRGQVQTIRALVEAGAEVDAADAGGVTPLHRAVRNRCAAAVKTLVAAGADPQRRNGNGSTPAQLASLATGRGGVGSRAAKLQQQQILAILAGRR